MLDSSKFPHKKAKLIDNLRKRLARFKLEKFGLLPNHSSNRAYNRLVTLKGLVKPAVLVVYFRTLLNGWCTSRRMRTLNGVARHNLPHCPLCGTGEDCIEHIANCKWTHFTFNKLKVPIKNVSQFLALDHAASYSNVLTLRVRALSLVYAVYNTMSHLPSDAPPP